MQEKRGQQMTLGTIILIVLGIAVLVFLIFGFTTGWNNLWDRITNLGGGQANIDTIVQACNLACDTNAAAAYCNQERTVKFGKDAWMKKDKTGVIFDKAEYEKGRDDYITSVKASCRDIVKNSWQEIGGIRDCQSICVSI